MDLFDPKATALTFTALGRGFALAASPHAIKATMNCGASSLLSERLVSLTSEDSRNELYVYQTGGMETRLF